MRMIKTMSRSRALLALASSVTLAAGAARTLRAQTTIVGTEPTKSAYQSIVDPTRVGTFAGLLFIEKDAAGVAPKSPVPITGIRYDYHVAGPTYFTSSLAVGHTSRAILDYNNSVATRKIGEKSTFLLDLDVGFDVAPTGDRSWHGVQPLVHLGAGYVLTPGDTREDASGYTFGGKFKLSWGLGMRWVTGKNSELRADLNWHLWQMNFPETYRSTLGDPVAIMPTGSLSPWTSNRVVMVGWTWGVFR